MGGYTYTSDQRFQSNHHPETDDWVLQIKWAQKRDAGMYECQISTQPVLSYFVNLNVVGEYWQTFRKKILAVALCAVISKEMKRREIVHVTN